MSDLVKRLRSLAMFLHDDFTVADEAADLIEKQQEELAAAKGLLEQCLESLGTTLSKRRSGTLVRLNDAIEAFLEER